MSNGETNKPALRVVSGRGRPSLYSEAIADEIAEAIALGGALYRLCEERPGWPSERTIYSWLDAHPAFLQKYTRARERAADRRAAEIVEIADSAKDAQLAKLQIDARRWQAAKFAPKRYGDRVSTEVTGPDGGPVEIRPALSPIESARQVLFAMELARRAEAAPAIVEGQAKPDKIG